MIRRLALALGDLAAATLPARRHGWGDAMRLELHHIADDREAMSHAGGCLIAAIKERIGDFDTRFATGIWSVAAVTAGFALTHLLCAWHGMLVLLGGPDHFLAAVERSGRADAAFIARYHAGMPIVVACFLALGLAHLAAAIFLARMQLARFAQAWCAAMVIAAGVVALQLSIIWTLDGLPSEFFALLFQALALPALLLWSNGRHRQLRRKP